jgi:hypothetical protein
MPKLPDTDAFIQYCQTKAHTLSKKTTLSNIAKLVKNAYSATQPRYEVITNNSGNATVATSNSENTNIHEKPTNTPKP